MRTYVTLDFETASLCDLKKSGAWRYAEDPTTEVLWLSWKPRGLKEAVFNWHPTLAPEMEFHLRTMVESPDVLFIAHNCAFEKAMWRCHMMPVYDWPDIPDERWHDTMAVCAMKVIPLDLDRAAMVMRLPHQKDKEGNALTKSLSRPQRKTGAFDRSKQTLFRVGQYCGRDVLAQDALHQVVGWLTPEERKVWLLDQKINQRGVRLDTDFVAAARKIVRDGSALLEKEFIELTGLKVTQTVKLVEWCRGQGLDIPNLQKDTLAQLLGSESEDAETEDEGAQEVDVVETTLPSHDVLPDNVRRALTIRQLIGSASVKKLDRMEACVSSDGQARGLMQYHGAGTGRWAGRLLQPQNFPRGTLKNINIDELVAAIKTGDYQLIEMLYGPAVQVIVSSLRHAIIARKGRMICAGDFSTIELRVNLALAQQMDKLAMLKAGGDAYIDMAEQIYKRPLNKKDNPEERQTGKTAVLGLGFQMGAPKFSIQKEMLQYDLDFAKEIVRVFREDWAPRVPSNWYELEDAACETVWTRRSHEAKGVTYALENGWLTARLPSGRKLWYRNPKPVKKAMPWDPADIRPAWTYEAMKMGQWKTIDAYGGLLTENVVQALARDLMVHAMFLAEDNGFPVCLTVHDELVTEPEIGDPDKASRMLEDIMADSPDWARQMQIPVKAEAWAGERYRK